MTPFKAPLDDMLFCLEAAAGASTVETFDEALAREIAGHFAGFAEAEIAPIDAAGDIEGCRLDDGRVRMPAGFAEVYKTYCDQGWPGLTAPDRFGGQEQGPLVLALTSEIFAGACHALQMVTGLVPGAIRTLLTFAGRDQQERFIPLLSSGAWLTTMCLTEAEAGSDLSRIRCRAVRDGGDWRIDGEKIFISGGDQDLSDGILHLVLARTGPDGLKGLSLFACPSHLEDGARNAVSVLRIEDKMGLHASPTCQLVFENARAELIGRQGHGLEAMFTLMNHARIDVALQGVAHAARAHDIARSHAHSRVQGRKSDGGPATLIDHADVVRLVDRIDTLAMGARAIAHLALLALENGRDLALAEFLTPVAKACCTDAGIEAANLGIQVLGGYGYLHEYRVEQSFRDARVTAIYEGANGIHERMLVKRLLRIGSGDAFNAYISSEIGDKPAAELRQAFGDWIEAEAWLRSATDPTPHAHAFLQLTAQTLLLGLWERMDRAAERHPDPARIRRLATAARIDCRIDAAAAYQRIALGRSAR